MLNFFSLIFFNDNNNNNNKTMTFRNVKYWITRTYQPHFMNINKANNKRERDFGLNTKNIDQKQKSCNVFAASQA